MGKIILKTIISSVVAFTLASPALAAASATKMDLRSELETLKASNAKLLAQKFWPNSYRREKPEWQKIASACDNAAQIKQRATASRQYLRTGAQRAPSGFLMKVSAYNQNDAIAFQNVQAAQNLRSNLLKKVYVHKMRILGLAKQEEYRAQNALDIWGVKAVRTFVNSVGNDLSAAIREENYGRCSRILHSFI